MHQTSWLKAAALAALTAAAPAFAQNAGHDGHGASPYAGFQDRAIKGLSQSDIDELKKGGGWGLALPAELNGAPGPAHVLELKDELDLTAAQIEAVEAIYAAMKADAIAAGERFIAAEAALSDAFAGGMLDDATLTALLEEAAQARAALRFVHLSRHLETPPLLTKRQIHTYNVQRGYADDPCASVPEGHNAALWRKHNGCE